MKISRAYSDEKMTSMCTDLAHDMTLDLGDRMKS